MSRLLETHREAMANVLNELPEVRWDRGSFGEDLGQVFGWIAPRPGAPPERADFVQLLFYEAEDELQVITSTSSAGFSATLAERVFGAEAEHEPCQRVEQCFGDLVPGAIRAQATG